MSFDFSRFITPWIVGGALLIMLVSASHEGLNNVLNGFEPIGREFNLLIINGFIFLVFLLIVIVPPVRDNIKRLIDKVFEYPIIILERFFKD